MDTRGVKSPINPLANHYKAAAAVNGGNRDFKGGDSFPQRAPPPPPFMEPLKFVALIKSQQPMI